MSRANAKSKLSVLGFVPARGGSKGVPRKNIRCLAGKPLIAYTIEAGLKASLLDRLIVSTEDEEIAKLARKYGAEVPFRRPIELARDDTSTPAVLCHALNWLSEREGYESDYIMLLQITSPFRTSEDMNAAMEVGIITQADAVVSVTPVKEHPYWMQQITKDGRLTSFLPFHYIPSRRQEVPEVYVLNGAIFLIKTKVFLELNTFLPERTYPYIMPPEHSLDIDTPWDFYLAELIMQGRTNQNLGNH